jgi:hypothetical protein
VTEGERSDYAAWMRLANDPSQTEEARQNYRARMDGFVRARLINALRIASGTASRPEEDVTSVIELSHCP